jgi:hypothetical protein
MGNDVCWSSDTVTVLSPVVRRVHRRSLATLKHYESGLSGLRSMIAAPLAGLSDGSGVFENFFFEA